LKCALAYIHHMFYQQYGGYSPRWDTVIREYAALGEIQGEVSKWWLKEQGRKQRRSVA